METAETREIKQRLIDDTQKKRLYGCEEVTIGFPYQGMGNEVVDFMTMNSRGVFRCYEIKTTLSDLRSSAKMSWYGDYNYLVVGEMLEKNVDRWIDLVPPDIGIVSGKWLDSIRKCKKKDLSAGERDMLRDSLIRSLSGKLYKNYDANNLKRKSELESKVRKQTERISALQKQLGDCKSALLLLNGRHWRKKYEESLNYHGYEEDE